MPMESQPLLDRMRQIEPLVAAVEQGTDPAARMAAQDLVGALLDVHAGALAKLLEVLPETARTACPEDELLSYVLLLHGLHPWDLETRVRRALDRVQPLLRRGGGELELLAVGLERVRVRLNAEPGCGSTVAALKGAVERAMLDAAPEVVAIEVEGLTDTEPALMQIGMLSRNGHCSSVGDGSEKTDDRLSEPPLAVH